MNEENNVAVDNTESTQSSTENSNEDTIALSKEEYAELQKKSEQFQNVLARAHKVEEELKTLKTKSSETPQFNNTLSEESVDVKILESKGVDKDAIDLLKKLAKVNGTSLLAAEHDPVFTTWKSNREQAEKAEKARLGASRGSGSAKVGKSMSTPNLSDDDHKAMWRAMNGK
jgi:hypothetical protein